MTLKSWLRNKWLVEHQTSPQEITDHHYVIQSLEHTLGLDGAVIAQFDAFRKKRNIGGYELSGSVSDQEAQEMFVLAKMLREKVEDLTHG